MRARVSLVAVSVDRTLRTPLSALSENTAILLMRWDDMTEPERPLHMHKGDAETVSVDALSSRIARTLRVKFRHLRYSYSRIISKTKPVRQ